MKFIKKFEELRITDIPKVGGKNANLGQMIAELGTKGIKVPTGFAITVDGYWHYLEHNKLLEPMKKVMAQLKDIGDIKKLLSKINSPA